MDDLDVTVYTLNDAVDIMRGHPGEPVTLVVERNGEELTFTVNRAQVNVNWVESGMLTEDVDTSASMNFPETAPHRWTLRLRTLWRREPGD